jgi:hypothetical protein
MLPALLGLLIFQVTTESVSAEIIVSSDFEGGSAVVVEQKDDRQFLHIQPEVKEGRGFPCWWYLKVSGLTEDQLLTLKVSANQRPYRGKKVLSASWLLPERAAISTDNVTWTQTPKGKREDSSIVYHIKAPAGTIWLAWGPPFLPSHADKLLKQAKEMLPDAEIFELARTRHDRPVKGIRFGTQPADGRKPFGVWIQARQHAWEAGSSWVARGFLLWAVSDDEAAAELRQLATIHVIPIMDVDSTAVGAGGKDSIPRDHNRDWGDEPHYPEVAAAQKRILKMEEESRFDVFIDLHNPGPGDRVPFFFGPIGLEKLPKIQQRNYVRFLAYATDQIDEMRDTYRFATYVKTQEERDRVSSNWVRNHTSPHVFTATLETAWNRPEGTQTGYQAVGRQLGQALLRYLEANPREE